MRKGLITAALTALVLAGCGGHCSGMPRPDTIALDAAALIGVGTDFEVCIVPDQSRPSDELCAEVGSPTVDWSTEELPDSFGYVARWSNNDGQPEEVAGSFDLQCESGTARYFLGPDY